MIKYKLTNQKSQTYGQTQWGENITHTASGRGPPMRKRLDSCL